MTDSEIKGGPFPLAAKDHELQTASNWLVLGVNSSGTLSYRQRRAQEPPAPRLTSADFTPWKSLAKSPKLIARPYFIRYRDGRTALICYGSKDNKYQANIKFLADSATPFSDEWKTTNLPDKAYDSPAAVDWNGVTLFTHQGRSEGIRRDLIFNTYNVKDKKWKDWDSWWYLFVSTNIEPACGLGDKYRWVLQDYGDDDAYINYCYANGDGAFSKWHSFSNPSGRSKPSRVDMVRTLEKDLVIVALFGGRLYIMEQKSVDGWFTENWIDTKKDVSGWSAYSVIPRMDGGIQFFVNNGGKIETARYSAAQSKFLEKFQTPPELKDFTSVEDCNAIHMSVTYKGRQEWHIVAFIRDAEGDHVVDLGAFPHKNTDRALTDAEYNRLKPDFPNMDRNRVRVTADPNPNYNCIAWTLGKTDVADWPCEPIDTPCPLESFNTFYNERGYEPVSDPDQAHIALLGDKKANLMKHGCRRDGEGTRNPWSSKAGTDLRFTHELADIVGQHYGEVVQYYRRKSS